MPIYNVNIQYQYTMPLAAIFPTRYADMGNVNPMEIYWILQDGFLNLTEKQF